MTDIELTKRTAEKCGTSIEPEWWCEKCGDYIYSMGVTYQETHGACGYPVIKKFFNPLHDWKDLMNIVVPILFETHWIHMCDDRFLISPNDTGQTRDGSYPAEFARAVCEALLEEEI